MKRKIILTIAILLCLSVAVSACAPARQPGTAGVTITDMAGRTVTVPDSPQSICVLDPYAAAIVVMLGFGERMPTTVNAVGRSILMQSICPPLQDAVIVKTNGAINAETVLQYQTDLIIVGADMYASADEKAKLDTMAIPYVVVEYSSMAEQIAVVTLLGEALQKEDTALAYTDYYEDCIDLVTQTVPDNAPEDAIRLYHSVNEAVRTDYPGSLGADWIGLMNVTNVSLDTPLSMTEDKAYATLEQIYNWDPDVIICNESGVADYILTDSKWQGLRAVLDTTVYQIPIGISRWGHPTSIETPLAILWLSEVLYPSLFETDIGDEVLRFYDTFYDYSLSADELESILTGVGVRTPKSALAGE